MFFKGSRYEKSPLVTVTREDGTTVVAVQPQRRVQPDVALLYHRHDVERLDHLAAQYLGDATAFWKLCDAANAIAPDALAAHRTIGIPKKGR
ncbi:MAG TPA: hypothetical protein VF266_00435 [Thermoanaerobaculia bacterium]